MKLPSDKKAIEVKSEFKGKHNLDGPIAKQKARLVKRDFLQRVNQKKYANEVIKRFKISKCKMHLLQLK